MSHRLITVKGRINSGIMLVMTLIFLLVPFCLELAEAEHECCGECCQICASVRQCNVSRRQLTDGIAVRILLPVMAAAVTLTAVCGCENVCRSTPVSTRVRLNN